MADRSDVSDYVGVGLYTTTEAARLLRTSPARLRRWLEGYGYERDGDRRRYPPLWRPHLRLDDGTFEITFQDLVELRFVLAFASAGLSLQAIRRCRDGAREVFGVDMPFSTGRFRTDGQTIFLDAAADSDDASLLDLRDKQYVFKKIVAQTFKDLDLEGDLVARWRPYEGRPSIVVDPERSFGQPIAAASGVPVVALADAVAAEGSVQRVAALYEIDRRVVEDAVRFHQSLMAA